MALSADLYNIKSSGTYTYIIDKSQVDIRVENRVMPLVVGFSDNGPRRMPVVITSRSQFYRYFGNENKKTEDKGNYFHKTATDLLDKGRFIYAMNLAPINESLIDMFNTDNGFTPNYGYTSDVNENKFGKIYNSGKPTHIFVFENTTNNIMKLNGYDLTVQEYYQSPSLNPSGLPIPEEIENPEQHRVYEYYRNIYAFDGYFDDYYLKSLYDSGYNNIIKKGTKILVGEIQFNGLSDPDTSRPEYQKIEFTNKKQPATKEGDPEPPKPVYQLTGINLTADDVFVAINAKPFYKDIDVAPIRDIEFTTNSTIQLCANKDVLRGICGRAGRVGDLLELGNVKYVGLKPDVDEETNQQKKDPTTEELLWKEELVEGTLYVRNGLLNGKKIANAQVTVTYSDLSYSDEFIAIITFNDKGFKIESNTPTTKVWYNIIGDDEVQIKSNVFESETDSVDQQDVDVEDQAMRIKMPFGCTINVDADGTETHFSNVTDTLALGSYSKLEMSTGNECYLYPNANTYITSDGIVVKGTDVEGVAAAVLAVKSTDMKIELSQIGEVDTLQRNDKSDEWIFIRLNTKKSHVFTFGDALEPFIIENTGGENEDGSVIYTGEKGTATFPIYCTPLAKTVALKVKVGTGSGDGQTPSEIISANGIEWDKFCSEVLPNDDPGKEWANNTETAIKDQLYWNVARQDGRPIAQTYYLTGGEKTIETLSMISGSGFIAKYSGFAIPNFTDVMGVNQEIKTAFNQDVFLHNTLLGSTSVHANDSQSNVICDWMESDTFSPLYDGNKIANALIDSETARNTAFKLLFGCEPEYATAEQAAMIPAVIDAPSCYHTGKAHKMGYGVGGYDYDYECLDPETTNKMDKILFKSLTDNPYLTYRYLVDTLIHNASYANGKERCNKWVGTAITFEMNPEKLRPLLAHHNLFKVVDKYPKAAALVNAPYPLKTSEDGVYNWTKEFLPSDMDGNWRGTYTTPYKMLNYDTNNTSLISCQGHIYPTAGRECELCFQKKEQRFIFTPVAGPNFGTVVDTYTVTPAETFGKDDRDVLEPLGINVLVYKDNAGTYINSNQSAKQRVVSALSKFHVAELLIQMTIDIQKMMLQLQWEMNTPQIRDYLKMKVDNYCEGIKNNKGLYSYYNICNRSNNTDEVIDNEMIVLDTGIEVARAMGKMVNRISIYKTGGIKLSGLV